MFTFTFDIAWLKGTFTHSLLLTHDFHGYFLMLATGIPEPLKNNL